MNGTFFKTLIAASVLVLATLATARVNISSSGGGGAAAAARADSPDTWAMIHADFLQAGVVPLAAVASSSGFATHSGSDFGTDHPGVVVASTSTSATAAGGLQGVIMYGIPDDSHLHMEVRFADLSTGAEEFRIESGHMNSATNAANTDGVYFSYDRATDGVNWQAVTVKDGTATTTDTGIVAAADTWYHLHISYYDASVIFEIDGVTVATNTTNILTTDDWQYMMTKIVKTVGTTARTLDIDLMSGHYKSDR